VMLTAGRGKPLLFLHGAGTWHGFDFALPWAAHHRVMIPYHPGWGESSDCPEMKTMHDYVMHYLQFIDDMNFDQVDLVGLSMGGRMAATFASEHRRRVRKLALVAPAGLDVAGYPLTDFSVIPPQHKYLIEDTSILTPHIPTGPDDKWHAERGREGAGFGKLLEDGLVETAESGPSFSRWLNRLTMPTMLVWGEKDRTTPIQQSQAWLRAVPGIQFRSVPNAGHLVLDESLEAVHAIGTFLAP
jgi:pimeloyl-ACP methyl ester carboxylesterase